MPRPTHTAVSPDSLQNPGSLVPLQSEPRASLRLIEDNHRWLLETHGPQPVLPGRSGIAQSRRGHAGGHPGGAPWFRRINRTCLPLAGTKRNTRRGVLASTLPLVALASCAPGRSPAGAPGRAQGAGRAA